MKILAPALLALGLASSLHAQTATDMVVVRGTLVDAENGNRVINGGARVEMAGERRRSAATDSAGQFALRLPRGSHFVVVSAPGFDAVAEVVDATGDVDMGQIEMSPAVFTLEPLAVTVNQLELRRQQNPISSRAVSGRILQHSGDSDLYEFIRHRFGLRVSPCNFMDIGPMGECVYIRGKGERPRVFIDEVMAPSGMRQLNAYRPEDVERVEVYAGGKLMMIYTRGYLEMLGRTRRITSLPPI